MAEDKLWAVKLYTFHIGMSAKKLVDSKDTMDTKVDTDKLAIYMGYTAPT